MKRLLNSLLNKKIEIPVESLSNSIPESEEKPVYKRINKDSFWVFLDEQGDVVAQFEKNDQLDQDRMALFMQDKTIVYD